MTRRKVLVAAWALCAAAALVAVVLISGAARSLPDLGPSLDLDGTDSPRGAHPTPLVTQSATPTATSASPTATAPAPTTAPRPTAKPAPTRTVRVQPRPPVHVPAPPPPAADDDGDDGADDDGAEEPDDDD